MKLPRLSWLLLLWATQGSSDESEESCEIYKRGHNHPGTVLDQKRTATFEQCCEFCYETRGCKRFVRRKSDGNCQVKDDSGAAYEDDDFDLGLHDDEESGHEEGPLTEEEHNDVEHNDVSHEFELALLLVTISVMTTLAVVAIVLYRRRDSPKQKHPSSHGQVPSSRTISTRISACNRHHTLHPSTWCVTPEQFFAFLDEVYKRYPDEDPDAYKVVEEMIKPMTEETGESYALMQNPEGVPVKHFITHAWGEGMKSFGESLRARLPCDDAGSADEPNGLWICFLANPQTWPSSQLERLLGANVWLSPFAVAIEKAANVIAVRNANINMYSRLWCVFELFVAHRGGKPIIPIGPMPGPAATSGPVGFKALCSVERDTLKLRAAMASCTQEVDQWVQWAMRSKTFMLPATIPEYEGEDSETEAEVRCVV